MISEALFLHMDLFFDYMLTICSYIPYILYGFVFLTLVPKSMKRIIQFANANYEANRYKYHRCYAPNNCCHMYRYRTNRTKPKRKGITRNYAKKQIVRIESKQLNSIEEPSNISQKKVYSYTNVNKIAKMFENIDQNNQKRIRDGVTSNLLSRNIRKCSMPDNDIDEANFIAKKRETFVKLRKKNHLNYNNEKMDKNSKILNENTNNRNNSQINVEYINNSDITTKCNSSIPITRKSELAITDDFGTSSLLSISPIQSNFPVLDMKSSLDDIFAVIARNAEESNVFLYTNCNDLAPVTSIDDILTQRRLSRPLSAYSISDLLNDESSIINTSSDGVPLHKVLAET